MIEEVSLLNEMPTVRLRDIMSVMQGKEPMIVNIDAIIPRKDDGNEALHTILSKLPNSVKTLSLRNNTLSVWSTERLIEWVATNNHLETLYTAGIVIINMNDDSIIYI